MNPNFDTLKAAKNLIAHGLSESQAEAIVSTFSEYNGEIAVKSDLQQLVTKHEMIEFRLATKQDMADFRAETKQEIADLRSEVKHDIIELKISTERDIGKLRVDIEKFKSELLVKIPAIIAAIFGVYKIIEKLVD